MSYWVTCQFHEQMGHKSSQIYIGFMTLLSLVQVGLLLQTSYTPTVCKLQTSTCSREMQEGAALPNNNAVSIKRSGLHFLVKKKDTQIHDVFVSLYGCV